VAASDLLFSVIFGMREPNGRSFWNKEGLLHGPGIRSSAVVIAELGFVPERKHMDPIDDSVKFTEKDADKNANPIWLGGSKLGERRHICAFFNGRWAMCQSSERVSQSRLLEVEPAKAAQNVQLVTFKH
jgi:hypothetical protein